nr:PREDICTED: zinc finger protein 431-like [Tribolium castaneum]|eukprot:XP_015834168.1 PREDICTED: zinc finger protein 431-like [Tribolium castaneum]
MCNRHVYIPCNLCNQSFLTETQYYLHKVIHVKERNESPQYYAPKVVPVKTKTCSSQVKVAQLPCKIPCNLCSETFSSENDYYLHKVVHVKEKHGASPQLKAVSKKKRCDICGKFISFRQLKKHRRTHF